MPASPSSPREAALFKKDMKTVRRRAGRLGAVLEWLYFLIAVFGAVACLTFLYIANAIAKEQHIDFLSFVRLWDADSMPEGNHSIARVVLGFQCLTSAYYIIPLTGLLFLVSRLFRFERRVCRHIVDSIPETPNPH